MGGFGLGGLTGGFGGAASVTAAAARVRSQAPRFSALLTALRAGVATSHLIFGISGRRNESAPEFSLVVNAYV